MINPSAPIQQDTNLTTYTQAFNRLEQIAQQLSQHTLTDIDHLLTLVDEALANHQICQTRIQSVESLLAEKLKQLD